MRASAKTSVMKRLKRIEGQVRGLARMVEDDRYCIDVVTQVSAVRAALRRAEEEVLADHVAHCVEHAIASGNKAEQRRKVSELMDVVTRAGADGRRAFRVVMVQDGCRSKQSCSKGRTNKLALQSR